MEMITYGQGKSEARPFRPEHWWCTAYSMFLEVATDAPKVGPTQDRWGNICDPSAEYVDEFRRLSGSVASGDGARECRPWYEVWLMFLERVHRDPNPICRSWSS